MLCLSVGVNWLLMAMLLSQFALFPPAMQPQATAETQTLLDCDAVSGMSRSVSMVSLVFGDETAEDSFTLESPRHAWHEKMRSFPSFGSVQQQFDAQSD